MSPRKRNTPLAPVTISTEHCTPEVKQQIIKALPLLVDLSSEERRSVSPVFREIGFAAGERIALEPVAFGEAGSSSQPHTRNDLASLSGTTTETASRVVSALQREGHLTSGRRWITLKDSIDRRI